MKRLLEKIILEVLITGVLKCGNFRTLCEKSSWFKYTSECNDEYHVRNKWIF
jgi:hypothetical protein